MSKKLNPKLFEDLLTSVLQMKAIQKGMMPAARRIVIKVPGAKGTREGLGLSQGEFSQFLQISVKTLQKWEQGRRNPNGPAATLLEIAGKSPELVLAALR